MSRFNHYFNNRFASCLLIAEAYDQHRDRDVRIYRIPGEVECVGVSDGVDSWIAPVLDELFTVPIKQVMRDLHDKVPMTLPVRAGRPVEKTPRRAILAKSGVTAHPATPEPIQRRSIASLPPSTQRRRVNITPDMLK